MREAIVTGLCRLGVILLLAVPWATVVALVWLGWPVPLRGL